MKHSLVKYLLIALFSVACLLSSLGLEYKTAIADNPQQVLNPETGNPLYGGEEIYEDELSTPAEFYELNGVPRERFTVPEDNTDVVERREGVPIYSELWHRGGEEYPKEENIARLGFGDSFTLTGRGYYLFESSGPNDAGGVKEYAFELDTGWWLIISSGRMIVRNEGGERIDLTEDDGITYDRTQEIAHDHLHEEPVDSDPSSSPNDGGGNNTGATNPEGEGGSCTEREVFADAGIGEEPQCYENVAEIECAIAGTLPVSFEEWPLPRQTCANVDGEAWPVELSEGEPEPSPPSSENLIFSWSGGDAFGLISADDVGEVPSVVVETEEISVGEDSVLNPTSNLAAEGESGMRVLADEDGNPISNPNPDDFSDVEFTNVGSLEDESEKVEKVTNGEGETVQGEKDDDGNIVREENGDLEPEPTPGPGSGDPVADGLDEWGGLMDGVLRTEGGILGFIAELIRWALGLLGTIFFVITLVAGFMYMTAGGDTQKISSAIGLVKNAIVGLVIIAGSYLITEYVISAVLS